MTDDLVGLYSDPLHGHCIRKITLQREGEYLIEGVYGDDEAPYTPGEHWSAVVYRDGKFLTVDFSGKAIKKGATYAALWCPKIRQIRWEDGNTWSKMYSNRDLGV
jgi:hypothetical protein